MTSTERGSGNAKCRSTKPRPPCRGSISSDNDSTLYWSVDRCGLRASYGVSINAALTRFCAKRMVAATEHTFLRYFDYSVIKTLSPKTHHALD